MEGPADGTQLVASGCERRRSGPSSRRWTAAFGTVGCIAAIVLWQLGDTQSPGGSADLTDAAPPPITGRVQSVEPIPALSPVPADTAVSMPPSPGFISVEPVSAENQPGTPFDFAGVQTISGTGTRGAWLTGAIEELPDEPAVSTAAQFSDDFPVRH